MSCNNKSASNTEVTEENLLTPLKERLKPLTAAFTLLTDVPTKQKTKRESRERTTNTRSPR